MPVKAQAYSTVRSQLEYASEIWNPNTTYEINRFEQVQRSSARFIFANYNKCNHVTPLIQELNLDSLHTRRHIQQATMLYSRAFQHAAREAILCGPRSQMLLYISAVPRQKGITDNFVKIELAPLPGPEGQYLSVEIIKHPILDL